MLKTDSTLTSRYTYCLLVPWSALVRVHWAKAEDHAEHCVVPCLAISAGAMNWEEQLLWLVIVGDRNSRCCSFLTFAEKAVQQ